MKQEVERQFKQAITAANDEARGKAALAKAQATRLAANLFVLYLREAAAKRKRARRRRAMAGLSRAIDSLLEAARLYDGIDP